MYNDFKSLFQCPLCTTELNNGRANIDGQSRFQSIRRTIHRDHFNIPFSHQLSEETKLNHPFILSLHVLSLKYYMEAMISGWREMLVYDVKSFSF